jgi:glycosyltransferase involved in cell wall biosynthesis
MSGRPRLLFLCQTLPYPPDSGVTTRSYNVLRLLAQEFDVTALCFYRRRLASKDLQVSRRALEEYAKVQVFEIPQEHSRARLAWDHVRSFVGRRVYTRYAYESVPFRAALRHTLSETQFDIVHVDSLDLSDYLPVVKSLPTVCVHHNVESRLLERRAERESSFARRYYLRHQAALMAKEEREWCPRVDLNVVVSSADARLLLDRAPNSTPTVVPNGVDVDKFRPAETDSPSPGGVACEVVSIGGVEWFPNRDALEFFASEILPLLREKRSEVSVRWIGRASSEEREHYRDRCAMDLTGYVDDVRPHLRAGQCFVVPLRVGGGTRLKILTAWALGKAVVSTSIGCEGLHAVHGENIMIGDTPREFARAVLRVLEDRALRQQLGEQARHTAEQEYSWKVIGRNMIGAYYRVLRSYPDTSGR